MRTFNEILIARKTYALVNDTVHAEEQPAVRVKGFAKPIRSYKIVGHHDDSADRGRAIVRKSGMRRCMAIAISTHWNRRN